MSKRYLVLGLSVVLALALAVPALGGPSNPIAGASATVKATAAKALKKAKAAQRTANAANATANAALGDAKAASNEAKSASTEAKKAQTTANTAQTAANSAQAAANSAKATADSAKAAAEAAEANANTRVKDSDQVIGTLSAENGDTPKFASAPCDTGEVVLGGGFSLGGAANKATVTGSQEQIYGGGWFVTGQTINGQVGNWSIQAIAICGTK